MSGGLNQRMNTAVGWLTRHRADLPAPVRHLIDSVLRRGGWIGRVALRLSGATVPPPIAAPEARVRVYIGPANYAGQGYEWARALERELPGVAARSASFLIPGGGDFGFPVDYRVPLAVYAASSDWQEGQLHGIEGFSHVLIESFTPLVGGPRHGSLAEEIARLRSREVRVALMCHGSDIRLPSRHRELNRWSPFTDDNRTRALEDTARRNHELLREFDGPVFVTTPDLLVDVPEALWCPVVVQPDRWAKAARPLLTRKRPRVVHVPSASAIKGTGLIADALHRLDEAGVIEYVMLNGIPRAEMPEAYGAADIVLDQFRIGGYGVAACEAMAAGRVVVGHVTEQSREAVRRLTGIELPVVQATADAIERVVLDIVERREWYREAARSGPTFIRSVHDGARSTTVLRSFLGA